MGSASFLHVLQDSNSEAINEYISFNDMKATQPQPNRHLVLNRLVRNRQQSPEGIRSSIDINNYELTMKNIIMELEKPENRMTKDPSRDELEVCLSNYDN